MSKLDVKFNLKRTTTNKDSEVLFRVNCGKSETFNYPLKSKVLDKVLRIPPCLWDAKKQCPVPISKIPPKYIQYKATVDELASIINRIKSEHPDILSKARINGIQINKAYLRKSYDEIFGFAKNTKLLVSDFLTSFINDITKGIILTEKKTKYAEGSIKPYRTLKNNLIMFDCINGLKTNFDDINQDWYDLFINFLYNEAEWIELDLEKEEYTPKSVGKYIKCLKHILKIAYNKGVSRNTEFQKDYFAAPDMDSFAVVLNLDEIAQLAKLEIEGEELECRDIFLVGCYSGLRQSDFNRIKPQDFSVEKNSKGENVTVLSITTKKTATSVKIPVVTSFLELVIRYNYNLPSVSSNKLNKTIKTIAKEAGITQEITYITHKGGELKEITVPKWKLIASHTCRRSAITNLYFHYKVESERIMRISGHKDMKTFRKYIRFGDTENALAVAEIMSNKK
ncbi:MAG: site-specific integrase [Bacteroidales bacterium]|nr:site-specific integrase [Bacteroidales bacterium]